MILSPNGKKLLAFVVLATVFWLLLCTVLLLRGRHQWDGAKAELRAQNETLVLAELAPTELPVGENFFAAPFWDTSQSSSKNPPNFSSELYAALGGAKSASAPPVIGTMGAYQKPVDLDRIAQSYQRANQFPNEGETSARFILRQLAPANAALAALATAAQRPGSRFLAHYDGTAFGRPDSPAQMNWSYCGFFSKALGLHAIASATAGDGATSFADAQTLLRVIRHLEGEPLFDVQFVRLELIRNLTRIVWTGLYHGCWTREQVEELRTSLIAIPIWEPLIQTHRGERARIAEWVEPLADEKGLAGLWRSYHGTENDSSDVTWLIALLPRGLLYSDLATHSRTTQQTISRLRDPAFPKLTLAQDSPPADPWGPDLFYPTKIVISTSLHWLTGLTRNSLDADIRLRQASIACSLELYRLAHDSYPASLADIPDLPLDPVTRQPFRYHLLAAGGYTMWSPGLDGTDEGGRPAEQGIGDLVWTMPARIAHSAP